MQRARVIATVFLLLVALGGLVWLSGNRPDVDEVALAEAREGVVLQSLRVDVGELSVHVVFGGPADGIPVVLLHGFPEAWFAWYRQVADLARAGFRVAAIDLRGYGLSDAPPSPREATSAHYARDVIGLLDALGWQSAHLSGHDVGGGVAWRLIFEHPERVRSALLFNSTHPLAWDEARPEDDEASISWFRSFFQLPLLPELVGRAGNYYLLGENLRATSREGTFHDVHLDVYKSIWARSGRLSGMIDGYRAPSVPIEGIPEDGRPPVPVRILWGEKDAFIPLAGAAPTARMIGEENLRRVPQASHWILAEEPNLTSDELARFFLQHERRRQAARSAAAEAPEAIRAPLEP